MNPAVHYTQSSYREVLLEHLFLGELLKHLWTERSVCAELLTPQVDDAGYDVAIQVGQVLRHIQLKSSFLSSSTASQKIHVRLGEKPSGCVIWIWFSADTMEMGPYLWFGSDPGIALPDLGDFAFAKHTKGDSTGHKGIRRNLHVIPKGKFEKLPDVATVAERLFGDEMAKHAIPRGATP